MQQTSSKILWWKWKKDRSDVIQQENERLILEQFLITMILNVDILCRVYEKKKYLIFCKILCIYRFQVHLVMNSNCHQQKILNDSMN